MTSGTPGHQNLVVKIKHHRRVVFPLAALIGESVTGKVLGRDRTEPQDAQVATPGQGHLVEHLRPGIDGFAGEGRCNVSTAVDGRDPDGIGKAVERQPAPG